MVARFGRVHRSPTVHRQRLELCAHGGAPIGGHRALRDHVGRSRRDSRDRFTTAARRDHRAERSPQCLRQEPGASRHFCVRTSVLALNRRQRSRRYRRILRRCRWNVLRRIGDLPENVYLARAERPRLQHGAQRNPRWLGGLVRLEREQTPSSRRCIRRRTGGGGFGAERRPQHDRSRCRRICIRLRHGRAHRLGNDGGN